MRIQKLLRILRLPRILRDIRTTIQGIDINLNPNIISIFGLFMYTLTVAHWLGCGLFLIARYQGGMQNGITWMQNGNFGNYKEMYYINNNAYYLYR